MNFNGETVTIDQIIQMTEKKSGQGFDLIFLN